MKKKVYAKPTLIGEEFVPNEYVAACENPTSYVGYCDISGMVYLDTNENQQYDPGIDKYEYFNTACNEKYESTTKPHINFETDIFNLLFVFLHIINLIFKGFITRMFISF